MPSDTNYKELVRTIHLAHSESFPGVEYIGPIHTINMLVNARRAQQAQVAHVEELEADLYEAMSEWMRA